MSFQIVQASLVECSNNHTITRIRIQTAGLAFGGTGLCSYRVRGVDCSCAEHLTVESYTVDNFNKLCDSHLKNTECTGDCF